nr:hypothetical protein [Sphingobacterium sp. UBA1498]
MVAAIIVDMDNLLINSETFWRIAEKEVAVAISLSAAFLFCQWAFLPPKYACLYISNACPNRIRRTEW